MIVRDKDVLAGPVARAPAAASTSACRASTRTSGAQLEPGTAPPLQRLRAVRELVDAGVRAGVLMNPIVPGISSKPALHRADDQGDRRSRRAVRRLQRDVPRGRHARPLHALARRRSIPQLVDGYDAALRAEVRAGRLSQGGAEASSAMLRTSTECTDARRCRDDRGRAAIRAVAMHEADHRRPDSDSHTAIASGSDDATSRGPTASSDDLTVRARVARKLLASFHCWLSGSLMRSSMTRFRKRAP